MLSNEALSQKPRSPQEHPWEVDVHLEHNAKKLCVTLDLAVVPIDAITSCPSCHMSAKELLGKLGVQIKSDASLEEIVEAAQLIDAETSIKEGTSVWKIQKVSITKIVGYAGQEISTESREAMILEMHMEKILIEYIICDGLCLTDNKVLDTLFQ